MSEPISVTFSQLLELYYRQNRAHGALMKYCLTHNLMDVTTEQIDAWESVKDTMNSYKLLCSEFDMYKLNEEDA